MLREGLTGLLLSPRRGLLRSSSLNKEQKNTKTEVHSLTTANRLHNTLRFITAHYYLKSQPNVVIRATKDKNTTTIITMGMFSTCTRNLQYYN